MALLKNKYEISIWEDLEDTQKSYTLLTAKPIDWDNATTFYYEKIGNTYTLVQVDPTTHKRPNWVKNKYYDSTTCFKESKLGIIGSDSMTSLSRALEPSLVSNINGTNTLTFKMYYTYIDTQTGEKVENSWIPLLANERRIKLNWKNKWYDFVIKNRVEDSSGKSVTFTCEDLFVNELSKTGFNLEFDTELENNQGTVFELAETTLADTDWNLVLPGSSITIDGQPFESEVIKQYTEEPVYLLKGVYVREGLDLQNVEDNDDTISINAGDPIILFYSQVIKQATDLQFIYNGTDHFPTDTNSLLITRNKVKRYQKINNAENFSWSEGQKQIESILTDCWIVSQEGNEIFWIPKDLSVSSEYRAERLVDSQKSILDPKSGKYVLIYTDNNDEEVYGFSKTDYNDSLMVTNLATWDDSGIEGWESSQELYWTLYPEFTTSTDVSTYTSEGYLRVKNNQTVYNTGVPAHRTYLPDGIQAGYQYRVRFRAMTGTNTLPNRVTTEKLNINNNTVRIQVYQGNDTYADNYFTTPTSELHVEEYQPGKYWYWQEFIFTCTKSIIQKDLKNVRIQYTRGPEGAILWLTNFQFFQVLTYKDANHQEHVIYPGDFDKESRALVRYYYYYPSSPINQKATSIDDIEFSNVLEEPDINLTPVLNENNTKIRSITIKQSNRFNILQTLAETFQCWVKFGIVHDTTGRIEYSADGIPKKYIAFVETIGEDKGYGFVYGIDLKTIQRTIQSKQLVTKTIVSPNSNEFGENGFCTIQRAVDNVPKTNFILNLDYFVANGMLDGGILANDLYSKTADNLGYYIRLSELNTAYDQSLQDYIKLNSELDQQQALLDTYSNLVTATTDELNQVENDLRKLSGKATINEALEYFKTHSNNTSTSNINDRSRLINQKDNYTTLKSRLETSITSIKDRIEEIKEANKIYVKQILDLDKAFNTKYARYLQEGSWISENYIDDNLYYLDGLNVAYTASRPQVQYNIAVLRLTALEEFKNKEFQVGDIGFIEDKEFFGYEKINGIKTPIKEQIVVSQITEFFDSPERDTITIQNYKTQFEDLFQRITSTTQSLQFAQGAYAKTASSFNSDGTFNADLLQSSLQQNLTIMTNATNEGVAYDQTGLTIVDINNPNQQMKLTSGGIIFTTDGINWTTGIDSNGMRANYIKAGVINTGEIIIGPSNAPTFRWDDNGISAYGWNDKQILSSQFVRFDQYGMYGIKGYDNFDSKGYYMPIDDNTTPARTYEPNKYYELVNGQYQKLTSNTAPLYWGEPLNYSEYEYSEESWNNDWGNLYTKDSDGDYILNTEEEYDPEQVYYRLTNPHTYYELVGQGLDSIKKYAYFGFTWDGFFLKGDGDWINITSDNGIEIINPLLKFQPQATYDGGYERSWDPSGNQYTTDDYIPLVSLGRYYDDTVDATNHIISYGLRLRNNEGFVTLSTDHKGELWSRRQIRAGDILQQAPAWGNDTYYSYNDGTYTEVTIEPDDWATSFINYYIKDIDSDGQEIYVKLETQIGNIAGLNGTSLTTDDISHLTGILYALGYINAYEVSYDTDAVPSNDLVQADLKTPYAARTAFGELQQVFIANNNPAWESNKYYVAVQNQVTQDYLYFPLEDKPVGQTITYIINDEEVTITLINWDENYNSYYQMITIPKDETVMSLNLFNKINGTNYTAANEQEEELPEGTYYVYSDNLDLSDLSVRIWAGADDTFSNSRFIVFKNGYVYAQQGYFEGEIHARNGNFSGQLTIGTGDAHGINGAQDAEYIFWSGKKTVDNQDSYQFYIDNTGRLYAQNADIAGIIDVEQGILHEIFLNEDGTSGLADDNISIWIGANLTEVGVIRDQSKFYITNDGRLYTTDVFLRGTLGIDPLPLPIYREDITYYIQNYEYVGDGATWDPTIEYYQGQFNEGDTEPNSYILYEGQGKPADWPEHYYILNGYKSITVYPSNPDSQLKPQVGEYITEATWIKENDEYIPILTDQRYKHGINDKAHGYVFWDGNFSKEETLIQTPTKMLYNFYVNEEGDVYARNLVLGNKLTAESVELNATLQVGNIILTSAGDGKIYHKQDNWYIDGNGFAEFQNARVRGQLTTVSFKKDSVSAVGGSLFISPTQVLNQDMVGEQIDTSNQYKFIMNNSDPEAEDWFGLEWSTVNEVSIKYNAIGDSGVFEEKEVTTPLIHYEYNEVTDFTDWDEKCLTYYIYDEEKNKYEQNVSLIYDEDTKYYERITLENAYFILPDIALLIAGSIFVSTDESTSSIFLVASEINGDINYGPRIEMRGGPKGESTDKVLIGNLNSRLLDTSFADFNDNAGSGLYANNVYLEGRFYLPQAGMTNEGNNNDSIRIWAGATPDDIINAPFKVTQDGSLYASKGIFKGVIEATDSIFSGWLKTVGILIDRNDNINTERKEDVFYVAYDAPDHPIVPAVENLILKIDKEGIAIWEGGFKVFTDTQDTSTPYYYSSDHNNPLPYIQAVEDLEGTNFRLLTKALQVSQAEYLSNKNQFYQSIGLLKDRINFQSVLIDSENVQDPTNVWRNNNFSIVYNNQNDSLKLQQTEYNYIILKPILDENFAWSLNSTKLDLGVTGSINVKGSCEVKGGLKVGSGLDITNTEGTYVWMKEYNAIEPDYIYTNVSPSGGIDTGLRFNNNIILEREYSEWQVDSLITLLGNNTFTYNKLIVCKDANTGITYSEGEPITITDLTNTTWHFNDTIDTLNESLFKINFYFVQSYDGSKEYLDGIHVHNRAIYYQQNSQDAILVYYEPVSGPEWSGTSERTITITGGDDVTNIEFIEWLMANAVMTVPDLDVYYNATPSESTPTWQWQNNNYRVIKILESNPGQQMVEWLVSNSVYIPLWENDKYFEYNFSNDQYILLEEKPNNWELNFENYYEKEQIGTKRNDEYSGFDFFVE